MPCVYELAYLLIATPGFTIVRRDGKWGMLNDRGRPIVPCVYDAVYYKEGHTVIDTQADTSEAGKSVAAPNGGFREKLLYMQKEGETEIFNEKGRRRPINKKSQSPAGIGFFGIGFRNQPDGSAGAARKRRRPRP